MYKFLVTVFLFLTSVASIAAPRFVSFKSEKNTFAVASKGKALNILFDMNDDEGVAMAANNLCADFKAVSGNKSKIVDSPEAQCIIVGTLNSKFISQIVKSGKINEKNLKGKREKYLLQVIDKPIPGVSKALVIAGSDKRGAIYGIYELSHQMGVSPWYWFMDVPTKHRDDVFIKKGVYTDGEPKVEYRGIFINDEWPAFGNWANEKFGGINSKCYEHIFELVLRLKGNFMWPAMWGSAFFDDDKQNGVLANKMGIVMGTSHHEPMDLAQQDWKRRGSGAWNYVKNAEGLKKFWQSGIERSKNWETIVTVGMRGDGDEAMDDTGNIKLLNQIIDDQRSIIEKVTGKKAEETPQVWALYKEVQDYYDNGMKVPDDITLLLCDDNWGNVRRLPALDSKPRKGGYGMYYHFDYVGAPRNTKWINTNSVPRAWEQLNLTYNYGVKKLWIVNVGDLKPMEYPITFFLDMAWNPEAFNAGNITAHTTNFCKEVFGEEYGEEASRLYREYAQLIHRVTPELLNATTYSLENGEWELVAGQFAQLKNDVEALENKLPVEYKDAYFQLIGYSVKAMASIYNMYYAQTMNHKMARKRDLSANAWADCVKKCFDYDTELKNQYHSIAGGKWNHLMDQSHIGYRFWNEPGPYNVMPDVTVFGADYSGSISLPEPVKFKQELPEIYRGGKKSFVFAESDSCVSIEAEHYSRCKNGSAKWTVIPEVGRTLSGITTMPVTTLPSKMWLEYDFETVSEADASVVIRLAPTLNFNNTGLRYAISIDGGEEKELNINGDYNGELGMIQAMQCIDSKSQFHIGKGSHTLRIRPLDNALVFQKIMIYLGGVKKSFLGPKETFKL